MRPATRHEVTNGARLVLGVLAFALLASHAAGQSGRAGGTSPRPAPERVVIPFDFESTFDDGRYGQMVGDLIWQKLRREGGFILPEAMQDVRDACERSGFHPGPDTPIDRMREVVRDQQAGDLAIWGKVERAPGAVEDVYDLWITVADFSGDAPRILYQAQARTETVSEIPHRYVKEALDALHGRGGGAVVAAAPDASREGRWRTAPNLVRGDFEAGREAPLGWDPLPPNVAWATAEGASKLIRFTQDEAVAGTTGVLYYSDFFPIEEGATYRFACRWRSTGSAAKVFLKCYDQFGNQRREVYRSQQNLKGDPGTWNVHAEDFTPKHAQFTPRWGRVMLYAYWPAGVVEWDDVVVKQIAPPPSAR